MPIQPLCNSRCNQYPSISVTRHDPATHSKILVIVNISVLLSLLSFRRAQSAADIEPTVSEDGERGGVLPCPLRFCEWRGFQCGFRVHSAVSGGGRPAYKPEVCSQGPGQSKTPIRCFIPFCRRRMNRRRNA